MRSLIFAAALALTANALADKNSPSAVKEVDKSTPAAAEAQDDNSSRSDKSSSVHLHAEGIVHRDVATREKGSGMATGRRQHSAATTCSNDIDNDCDDASDDRESQGATRAQDYNSSRSNTTSARLDDDSDGDSILEEVRCSKTSDDCVGTVEDGGPVVRKKPGKH